MTLNKTDWQEMKRHAFDAFTSDGAVSTDELEKIIEIGCADGDFDEDEKDILINIIFNLTRADMSDDMWAKIDELIHKFQLDHDSEATIELLDDVEEDLLDGAEEEFPDGAEDLLR